MNELKTITINNTDISVKEYRGKRVVTLKEIDQCHGRPNGTARKRFNDNKTHFIEGVDYFKISPSVFRTAFGTMDKRQQNDVTLLTESGYLMLVKSFTDDLAWDVQRQLVNSYFGVEQKKADDTLKIQIQQERSRAMLLNAQYRMLKLLMGKPELQKLSPVAVETLGIKATESIINANLGEYLPEVEKTYSATEVGNALGITAAKVGKIANAHGLKTDEYGITVMDKSRYSSKEVPSFRYNERGKAKIREILEKLKK
ncbi:ORF6N domain-containing protein [Candidatus Pseudoruminococcus sp.]|uniref:ORF6N domain-containing protein n=1 Tax=Candidatus Pseudoruminococcus sp. TaxID=3101048 RepID=UPI00399AFA6E